MPHVSSKVIQDKIRKDLEKNLYALITNPSSPVRRRLFFELLTPVERKMLAKRLGAIVLLSRGESSRHVSSLLGVSLSTTERFGYALERGVYKTITSWFPREKAIESFVTFIGNVLAPALGGRRKTLGQITREL